MKKLFGLFLAGALLFAPLAGLARAEKIDFGKLTCGDFVDLDGEEVAMLYFWIDGYLSAKTGNLVLDTDDVEKNLTELSKACNADKKAVVLKLIGQ